MNPIESIELRCWPGSTRHSAMNEASRTARLVNRTVRLVFNDQAVDMSPDGPLGDWYAYP